MAGGSADVLAVASRRRHGQRPAVPPARRQAGRPPQLLPRERRRRAGVGRAVGVRASSTTAARWRSRRQVIVPGVVRGRRAAGRLPGRAAGERGRGARRPARREAAAGRAGRSTTRSWRSSTTRWLPQRTRARRVEALEELRERLNLESLPVRIECFDISNLGEPNTVASMVVFEDAVAKRSDYRKFGIRHDARPGRLREHGRGGRPPVRAHDDG